MCDCDDDTEYVPEEERWRRSGLHMKRRVQKKRSARWARDGRVFAKQWNGRHDWWRPTRIPITGISRAWKEPGGPYIEVNFRVRDSEIVGVEHPDDTLLEAYEAEAKENDDGDER